MKRSMQASGAAALLCACFLLMPATAFADSLTGLYVNGTDITAAQGNTVPCGDGTAVYDAETGTLTLTDAAIESVGDQSAAIVIPASAEVTLVLNGQNSIEAPSGGISAGEGSALEFTGEGALTINTDSGEGIASGGTIAVNGPDITVTSANNDAFVVIGALTVKNSSTVNVTGLKYGIRTGSISSPETGGLPLPETGGISLSEKSRIEAYTTGEGGIAVWSNGDLTVSEGSSFNAVAGATPGTRYSAYGVEVWGDVTIDNSSFRITCNGETGILVNGSMEVMNTRIGVTAYKLFVVLVKDTLHLTNAGITASGYQGIAAITAKEINLDNSEIFARGGIKAWNVYDNSTDGTSMTITPASGKLVEMKVDTHWLGSNSQHFTYGELQSPFDGTVSFDASIMTILRNNYGFVSIGQHTHNITAANCTSPSVCNDCGQEFGSIDSHNHAGSTAVKNAEEATCHVDGYSGDVYCLGCNELLEHGEVIEAEGHEYDAAWKADAVNHWHECESCEATDVAAHAYGDWVVTKEATSSSDGIRSRSCQVCGYTVTETIKAADLPKTGDTVSAEPLACLLLLSLAGLLACLKIRGAAKR